MSTDQAAGQCPVERPLGLEPKRDTAASEMSRLLDMNARQAADVRVLETAVAVVSRALDDLVGACIGADGKPRAPDRGAVMRARAMLPPACNHALKKA